MRTTQDRATVITCGDCGAKFSHTQRFTRLCTPDSARRAARTAAQRAGWNVRMDYTLCTACAGRKHSAISWHNAKFRKGTK